MMENKISLRKIFFNLILFLSAYYLGLTFIAASLDKIIDPYAFSANISGYEVMPSFLINLSALFVPWIELICGILLLFGVFITIIKNKEILYIDASNNIIILMLLWFIFILSVAHIRGLDIDCGCGLGETKTLPIDRLKEDIYLLIMAFIIKFRHKILSYCTDLGKNK